MIRYELMYPAAGARQKSDTALEKYRAIIAENSASGSVDFARYTRNRHTPASAP